MESITLGQIGAAVAFIVALIGGFGYLHGKLKTGMAELLKDQLDSIDQRFSKLSDKLDVVDMETCKNFLVMILAEVEKGTPLNEIEAERFWEQYEHYTQIGGNGYIKAKVDKLKADGKL